MEEHDKMMLGLFETCASCENIFEADLFSTMRLVTVNLGCRASITKEHRELLGSNSKDSSGLDSQ